MADNTQRTNRLIVGAILIGLAAFAYSSFDARLRLRPDMPKDFMDNSKSMHGCAIGLRKKNSLEPIGDAPSRSSGSMVTVIVCRMILRLNFL